MTREEAIVKFEKQLTSAMVVLDSGFGTRPGESDRLYRERKEMAEIALSALRAQQTIPVTDMYDEDGGEVYRTKQEHFREITKMVEPLLAVVSGKPCENITLDGACELATYIEAEGWIIEPYPEWDTPEVTHWMPLPEPPEEGIV